MSARRWFDHLLPWLSWTALAATDAFSAGELLVMAVPLLLALPVEYRRWELGRYHRGFELLAVAAIVIQFALRIGLVVLTVNTLFVLCGARLMLPRQQAQRRQLVLMSFLLFLVTAIATFEMGFLFWTLAWLAGALVTLLQQNWDEAAVQRRGVVPTPPYRQLPRWFLATVMLAGLCFLVLPRHSLGLRFFPLGMGGLGGQTAGLSDRVELFQPGAIGSNSDVVLRIQPPSSRHRAIYENALQYLRGFTLEEIRGQRWETVTTATESILSGGERDWNEALAEPETRAKALALELFVAPQPFGVIPIPNGYVKALPPQGMPLLENLHGELRWQFPSRRSLPLRLVVWPSPPFQRRIEKRDRLRLLNTGEGTESVARWSRRVIPDDLPADALANGLQKELQTFAYSTENPSGGAADPLEDFLERTRKGHCEFFASTLALALRHRGVPARLVNGYRLGPWLEVGGYWLVTQDQAHSWVEYYDDAHQRWITADPTPPGAFAWPVQEGFWASAQAWADALRYRWDRAVVRYSGDDQMEGLAWLQGQAQRLQELKIEASWRRFALALALVAFLPLLAFRLWKLFRPAPEEARPHAIRVLRPLLRRTQRDLPPNPGETARAWLHRLAHRHSRATAALEALAHHLDAVAYGGRAVPLKPLVKEVLERMKE
ncbi:MAG: DUF3488 and transglutaminase-like domain-containing protein [Firmicutes bacterium]|nr:DUF3488 and transglutaminase-like domain-containing protein [Bacillota bacterium]